MEKKLPTYRELIKFLFNFCGDGSDCIASDSYTGHYSECPYYGVFYLDSNDDIEIPVKDDGCRLKEFLHTKKTYYEKLIWEMTPELMSELLFIHSLRCAHYNMEAVFEGSPKEILAKLNSPVEG